MRPSRKHDDAIGDRHHLAQPVRDVDHAEPLLAEDAQQIEEPTRVRLAQRGGRFVEEQDLGVQREGARYFDALLLAGRQ